MIKLNYVTILGGILVLLAVSGTWFSYTSYLIIDRRETFVKREYSPFTLNVEFWDTDVFGDAQKVIGTDSSYFYDVLASLIGVSCIIGAILGPLGESIDRWIFTFAGGLFILISALSFFYVLPTPIRVKHLTIKRDWYLTVIGSIFIIFSIKLKRVSRGWIYRWTYR